MRYWILLFPLLVVACMPTDTQVEHAHDILNVLTDVGQPLYEMTVRYCHVMQLDVVEDPDRTLAQKKAKIAKIRTFCKRAKDSFEAAIAAQKVARLLLDNREVIKAVLAMEQAREHIVNGEQEFARFREQVKP